MSALHQLTPGTGPAEPPPVVGTDGRRRRRHARRRGKLALLVLLLVLVLLVSLVSAWYVVVRRPLSSLPGLSGHELPAAAFDLGDVALAKPMDVALSPDEERIYVTSSEGDRAVHVFDRSGAQVGTLDPGRMNGETHLPVYLAVNPTSGWVYVSDRFTAAVEVYDDQGSYQGSLQPSGYPGGHWQPMGLAFDATGTLYVADVAGDTHRIVVVGADGAVQRTLGDDAGLAFPNGVAVDAAGNVAVADSNNGRVVVFDPAGQMRVAINRGVGDGDLGLPRGVAFDGDGRLYVVDTINHCVRVYRVADLSQTPEYVGSYGDLPGADSLVFPNGIATDTHGRVYVTDRDNDRVQVWAY